MSKGMNGGVREFAGMGDRKINKENGRCVRRWRLFGNDFYLESMDLLL